MSSLSAPAVCILTAIVKLEQPCAAGVMTKRPSIACGEEEEDGAVDGDKAQEWGSRADGAADKEQQQ